MLGLKITGLIWVYVNAYRIILKYFFLMRSDIWWYSNKSHATYSTHRLRPAAAGCLSLLGPSNCLNRFLKKPLQDFKNLKRFL